MANNGSILLAIDKYGRLDRKGCKSCWKIALTQRSSGASLSLSPLNFALGSAIIPNEII
jgi:hypothetical protein